MWWEERSGGLTGQLCALSWSHQHDKEHLHPPHHLAKQQQQPGRL